MSFLSTIDHENFQEEQLNSRRFPVFPEVVDALLSSICFSRTIWKDWIDS